MSHLLLHDHLICRFRESGTGIYRFRAVADLGGRARQNHMLAPPGGLAPHPTGNPGSAPVNYKIEGESLFLVLLDLLDLVELRLS